MCTHLPCFELVTQRSQGVVNVLIHLCALLLCPHRLAAFICGYTTVTIVISGNYSLNNFKEDLQKMYKRAGLKGEGLLFLLTDSQVVDERMLVYVNDLLASGEIPDLFPQEDKDEIINAMRSETKSLGLLDTPDNCWATFIGKVKANLHVAFTSSPVGEAFRVRSQRFLATINSTVIDWFQPWPEASLHSVAKKFLDECDLGEEAVRTAVVEFMPFSFSTVNKVWTAAGAAATAAESALSQLMMCAALVVHRRTCVLCSKAR